jgi:2-dehydro-3-deoxyphosphogluconate aldolase/(4S)-4-hydroxy-2-oxoglutarate aldolase
MDPIAQDVERAPTGIVAVIRAPSADRAERLAIAMADAGVSAVEITMTVPDAVTVIERLEGLPARLGAGTVLDAAACTACVQAGASFVVAPDTTAEVIARAVELRVPVVPGVLTPTEVRAAQRLGADAFKVFPISAVGGPAYVSALLEPFPGLAIVASGGVRAEDAAAYFAAGCTAVCLGRQLIDAEALAAGDVAAMTAHARRVLARATAAAP